MTHNENIADAARLLGETLSILGGELYDDASSALGRFENYVSPAAYNEQV